MTEILFTHDDLDGAGCRIVFEIAHHNLKKGEDYDVINCSNNNINSKVEEALIKADSNDETMYINEDTTVYFGDICPSLENLETLMSRTNRKVEIWDHHRTNFPATQVVPNAVIIPENNIGKMESGTSLMYQYYCMYQYYGVGAEQNDSINYFNRSGDKDLLSQLVENIRSYDTFEFKETGNIMAKKLQILFFLLGMDKFCDKYILRIKETNDGTDLITPTDMDFVDAKIEAEQKIIDSITPADIYDINIRGYRTAFLMTPTGANISELSYQFLQRYPEFEIFASFTLARGGEFSFRTQLEDLNLGDVIAAPIGGGGHPKASGAPVQKYIKDLLLSELVANMNGIYDKSKSL